MIEECISWITYRRSDNRRYHEYTRPFGSLTHARILWYIMELLWVLLVSAICSSAAYLFCIEFNYALGLDSDASSSSFVRQNVRFRRHD